MAECGCRPYEPCPMHEELSAEEAAALRAEVERLTEQRALLVRDRLHARDRAEQAEATRDAAQARLAALCEAATNAVMCLAPHPHYQVVHRKLKAALAAAQSGDGRKEDGDG